MQRLQLFMVFVSLLISIHLVGQDSIKVSNFDMSKCKDLSKCKAAKLKAVKWSNVARADELLRSECGLTNNDRYAIICVRCEPLTIIHYPIESFDPGKKKTSSLSSKGDNKIYTILQLKEVFLTGLAAFDSLVLDIQNMPVIDRNKARTLYFKTLDGAKKTIYPYFDKELNVLVLKKALFDGNDDISVSAYYKDDDTEKLLSSSFNLHFVNEQEKKEILSIAADVKKVDSTIFEDTTMIDYLEGLISGKYDKVDDESFNIWFSQQNY